MAATTGNLGRSTGVTKAPGRRPRASKAAADRIARALADGITVVYQPITNLHNGRVVGYESLSRFDRKPERAPDAWFREAAVVGRALEFELAAVAATLRSFDQLPRGTYLSFNVSPETACSPELASMLEGFPADRLIVEITEHTRVEDYKPLEEALAGLRARGLRIAIDDVGSGFSTLSHVLRLRPDVLKLDRELVQGIEHDAGRAALVASLVGFAVATRMTLVAEGVEGHAEAAALRALGVRQAQGFYLGAPEAAFARQQRARAVSVMREARYRLSHSSTGRRRSLRRRVVPVLLAATLGGGPILSAMVANAEPGGMLWGARLQMERMRLFLETDPEQEAVLHLEFANRRVAELSELVSRGADPALIRSVSADLTRHADAAVHTALADRTTSAVLRKRARSALLFNAGQITELENDACAATSKKKKACGELHSTKKQSDDALHAVEDRDEKTEDAVGTLAKKATSSDPKDDGPAAKSKSHKKTKNNNEQDD